MSFQLDSSQCQHNITVPVRLMLVCLCAALLSACAITPPQTSSFLAQPASHKSVLLKDVPFYAQKEYQCGPAALAMALNAAGASTSPDQLVSEVYLPDRKGSIQVEMLGASRRQGFIPFKVEGTIEGLIKELQAHHSVLVFQNLALPWYPQWHYAVVVGYDAASKELILHSAEDEWHRTNIGTFERTWARTGYWGFVPLKPGLLTANQNPDQLADSIAQSEQSFSPPQLQKAYSSVLKQWPDNLQSSIGLSVALYLQKRYVASERVLRNALKHHPASGVLYNNLAVVLKALNRKTKAKQAVKKAIRLEPNNQNFAETLSEVS